MRQVILQDVTDRHHLVRFSSIEEYLSSGLETNSSHTYTSDPYGKIVSILRTSMRQYFPIDNTPVIREWIPVLIFKVVQVASHWPRFFFQRLQTTTVRLVLLPKAGSNPDDVLTISNDVCHMIQVMGVVQQRSRLDKKALLRRIEAVEIAVNVNEICPESIRNGQYTKLDLIYSTQKATQLKGDYFHSEFCIRFPQSTQVMMHSNSGGILRQSDRIFCIHAHPIIIDSLGSHWDLSANAGATDESVLVRVESLPLATTQPMQAALHLSTTQSQSDSQDPSEVCQSINSGPTTSSTSAAVAPSTATTNTSSSHSINQKSDLTKSKIASRTPDGWKSQTKNRPKKTGSVKFSPYNLK
ncbi:unnamed protein product [Trichobilharzia regenti]|nr:unnamed protein product [Trichobilharzia regenti]